MPRGGKRVGAGRKPGAATIRTRNAAERAAGEGALPLDVQLQVMRYHFARFQDELASEAPRERVLLETAQAALLASEKAAPYIHPRLSSVEAKVRTTIEDLSEEDLDAQIRAKAEAAGLLAPRH